MYRYSGQNRFNYVMKPRRFRWVIAIVLVALAVFFIFRMTGTRQMNEENFINQRNAKLRSEMQLAVSQTNALSRLGATSTSGVLGRIRQYVHGVEVVNELNVSMYGEMGRLFQQQVFDNLYAIMDTYDAKLNSGQKVNDSLAELNAAIENLSTLVTEVLERQ